MIQRGLLLKAGTVVDAKLIAAPTSTKNKDKARDPEMHSSKKGNQWYFGMKAHIGADAESGLVHTVRGTSGHVGDVTEGNSLLHGQETIAFGDAGYQGTSMDMWRDVVDMKIPVHDNFKIHFIEQRASLLENFDKEPHPLGRGSLLSYFCLQPSSHGREQLLLRLP